MPERRRADIVLVERGLFESRARAQAAIDAGLVSVDGEPIRKASDRIFQNATIDARPEHPWVSRGGVKLTAALDHFGIDPAGLFCLDIGASTGGFTDVLLARGAHHVCAVDVGTGQIHPRVAHDARVTIMEGTDIRLLPPDSLPYRAEAIVIDVSFISLKLVLPAAVSFAAPAAKLVALVKPQFEAGRQHLKKGIIRDPAIHDAVCSDMTSFVQSLGWHVAGIIPSPVTGGDGNIEFLLGATR